jgi:hypothetical protein
VNETPSHVPFNALDQERRGKKAIPNQGNLGERQEEEESERGKSDAVQISIHVFENRNSNQTANLVQYATKSFHCASGPQHTGHVRVIGLSAIEPNKKIG